MQLLFDTYSSFESVNPSHRHTLLAEELECSVTAFVIGLSLSQFVLQNGFLSLVLVAHPESGDFRWAGRHDHASQERYG